MAVSIRPYPHLTKLGCQIPESEVSDFPQKLISNCQKIPSKVSEDKNDLPRKLSFSQYDRQGISIETDLSFPVNVADNSRFSDHSFEDGTDKSREKHMPGLLKHQLRCSYSSAIIWS
jgi:hypothetical protein